MGLAQEAYRKRHKALGLCSACSKPATNGVMCQQHRERYRELQRWRRSRAKKFGRCIECKRKHYRNGSRCELCILAVQLRGEKARRAGMCSHCHTKPARAGIAKCAQCAERAALYHRRRREQERAPREPEEALSKPVLRGASPTWRSVDFQI
jgi:hypothetical protein